MRTNRRERKNKALRQWYKNNRDIYDSNQSLESLTCDRILKKALSPRHINDTLVVIRDVNAGFSGKIKVLKAKNGCFRTF